MNFEHIGVHTDPKDSLEILDYDL